MAKYYAWSELRNGGEFEQRTDALGNAFTVITKRNVVMPGEEVTQKQIGVSDEEWEEWVARGVVREYPLPEEAVEGTKSPMEVILARLYSGEGEIDPNDLLALQLTQTEVVNPPASEGKELKTPAGT